MRRHGRSLNDTPAQGFGLKTAKRKQSLFSVNSTANRDSGATSAHAKNVRFLLSCDAESDKAKLMRSAIRSYIPETLIRIASADPDAKLKPTKTKLECVAVLADISGFTKKSEEFCAEGAAGLDKLQALINTIFMGLIKTIQDCGGDIIKFAGDSMFIIWPFVVSDELLSSGEEGGVKRDVACGSEIDTGIQKNESFLKPLILAAIDCGLSMSELELNGLTLHTGMTMGTANFYIVGGVDDQWDYVLDGDLIDGLGIAESNAKSGELIATANCYSHVADLVFGTKLKKKDSDVACVRVTGMKLEAAVMGAQDPSLRKPLEKLALSSATPQGAKLVSDMLHFFPTTRMLGSKMANEVRSVTIVFLNLEDDELKSRESFMERIEADNATSGRNLRAGILKPVPSENDKLQLCVSAIMEETSKFGGSFQKIMIDEKGKVVILAWGVPNFVHDNDPIRACSCAHNIVTKRLRKMSVTAFAGISTGRVFYGQWGNSARQESARL